MHPHRVQIFDRADDDAVIRLVADDFHLHFFPADQRLLDQELLARTGFEAALADFDKFFLVVGNAAPRATQGKGRTNDDRKTKRHLRLLRFFQRVGDHRAGGFQTGVGHRGLEFLPVFRLVNRFFTGANQLDAEFFQNAVMRQFQCTIQRRLSAHRRQNGVRAFFLDDFFQHLAVDRLDIGHIGRIRVGHDRRRIGVDQNDLVTLLAQCLAGLRAGIVELARLADHDRAGADDENTFDVCTFWHFLSVKREM